MAKKEVKTDLWVAKLLDEANIKYDAQGSEVKQLDKALSTASKSGTGNPGYPEFVFVSGDFVVVIEDKASLDDHVKLTEDGVLDMSVPAVRGNAVNGAVYYAMHIAEKSPFKKTFAVGVSGNEKMHHITPLYVDDRGEYKELDDLESFVSFSPANVYEYYVRNVLEEDTDVEKTTVQILKDAAELHDYLRTYGSLKDQDKPLVVSGILLALDEIEHGGFTIDSLRGDDIDTDGEKIYNAIKKRLKRSNVGPDAKREKLMSEFTIIKTSARLNEVDGKLGKTPLRFYTEFLHDRVFKSIKYHVTSEDFIGRFYGEFMSYSGGDGQTLGIVLTPKHICDLFCDLLNIGPDDVCLDPCCGTAGFLIAAMHRMLAQEPNTTKQDNIKKRQLHGFELQSNMFAIACTNMILRKDGNSNLQCIDFLKQNTAKTQLKGATIGMMNPPYSQGTKDDPDQYEISFVEHLLDSLVVGGRAAVIVPQSTMTGKTKAEQDFKKNIMKHHTLEGVITCNTDTFYGVGTNPVIAVFTAHEPHPKDKVCKFIDFRDDGYRVHAHIGLVEEEDAKDKRAHLLDVWRGNIEAPTSFCVESTVEPADEWLHSFYYFNDAIPTDADFERAIGDYLTFEFSMVMQNREYLFTKRLSELEYRDVPGLDEIEWAPIELSAIFDLVRGREGNMAKLESGDIPLVSARNCDNGLKGFVGNPGRIVNGNVITMNNDGDGGAGLAYYQPMDMALDTHVTALVPKQKVSRHAQMFMARCISGLHGFFGHGRSISNERARRTRVMMPVDSTGEPDYAYMEQYAMNMMRRKYEQYLAYLESN